MLDPVVASHAAEGGDESGGALRMNLMGWNKETLYTDYAVLGTWPGY